MVIDEFCVSTLGPFGALICDGTADSGALGAFSWLFFQVVTGQRRNDPEVDKQQKEETKQSKGRPDGMRFFIYLFERRER